MTDPNRYDTIRNTASEKSFAIARFRISKDDLYAIETTALFPTLEDAESFYITHDFINRYGGTWQERWEYHVVEVKDGRYRLPGGEIITTVLDTDK